MYKGSLTIYGQTEPGRAQHNNGHGGIDWRTFRWRHAISRIQLDASLAQRGSHCAVIRRKRQLLAVNQDVDPPARVEVKHQGSCGQENSAQADDRDTLDGSHKLTHPGRLPGG